MIDYKDITLENGLRLIINEDKNTELVAVNMLYKVGAKNEQENHTGFAHLFEHLMFSGSENFPQFDSLITSIGGESNAFTNNDITNFYVTVPYIYLETILHIEADRMRNLIIDEQHLSLQKKVVIEEFKQRYLNQPYGDLYKEMRELSYKYHPYKWLTIGKDISHIENATLDIVRNFYNTYYQPNNAVLSISGRVEVEKVISMVKKIFSFPSVACKQISYQNEPPQTTNREKTLYRDVPSSMIVITFPMSSRKDKEFYRFDLLSDLLSNGTSSRMYNFLVQQTHAFTAIDAVVSADDDAGLFIIMGKLAEQTDMKKGEELIWRTLKEISTEEISDREFQKVKNKNLVTSEFNNIKILDKAMNLAYYDHLDMLEYINKDRQIYDGVQKEEVVNLAKQTFFERCHNTLYYFKNQHATE
ncbi:MAG: pitrilysin family protein [Bacteroidota bacterium]|nr:pitrilysin family protein [Bacteroidota bacterium]